jgi:hypothetical protein
VIVDLKDYVIAAILLDIAQKDHSGFARVFDAEQFRDELERVYGADLPVSLISSSVHKLVELGGGQIVSDPFTSDYIYLDARSCTSLFHEAEDNPKTVAGRAYLIGSRFIVEAFTRIVELGEANLLAEFYDFDEPDRLTAIDRPNDPAVKEIDQGFEQLERELLENNESVIQLGDSVDVARQEVSALKQRWLNAKIRAASFVNQAQQTLVWISREAGKTVVGETAKKLFQLIMSYFF